MVEQVSRLSMAFILAELERYVLNGINLFSSRTDN